MKRAIIMATAATAMLASCMKTEVNPVVMPAQEISYQAVTGPNTKTIDPTHQIAFSTTNKFSSYAYYLPDGKDWETNKNDAKEYISGAEIFYQNNLWKSHGNPYFWPKDGGKLTFFAWSVYRSDVALASNGGTVSCTPADGIKATGYDAGENKNYDFMVADIKIDQSENQNEYLTKGVPTLFRHKLCQVKYKINTNSEYQYIKFYLNSLTIKNIYQKGNYAQEGTPEWSFKASEAASYEKENVPYSSAANYTGELGQTSWPGEDEPLTENDQYYFIPQLLQDAELELKYTILTKNPGSDEVSQEITKTIALNSTDVKSIFYNKGWEANKKYTINITIGLNEILWDPIVEDWTDGTSNDWSSIDPGTTADEGAGA